MCGESLILGQYHLGNLIKYAIKDDHRALRQSQFDESDANHLGNNIKQ